MPRDWARVGRYVRRRRHDELHLTQPEVTTRGGPSVPTIRNIETGKKPNYHPRILRDLEEVLGWEQGSCLAIGDGREPRLKVAVELGKLLVDRRLWFGGLDRDLWCAQQHLDPQLAYDIEHGLRSDYSMREMDRLREAYRLRRGAIRTFLAGEVTELAVDDLIPAVPVTPVPAASPGIVESSQLRYRAKAGVDAVAYWADQILAEMEANGGEPEFRNEQEETNWRALAAAGQPPEELVMDAAWWRMRDAAPGVTEAPRRTNGKTALLP